jgi:hypothetical protein
MTFNRMMFHRETIVRMTLSRPTTLIRMSVTIMTLSRMSFNRIMFNRQKIVRMTLSRTTPLIKMSVTRMTLS